MTTIRDPVARLESAFRKEAINALKEPRPTHMRIFSRNRGTLTLRDLVHILRNESHDKHSTLLSMWNRSYLPTYSGTYIINGGNAFLTPQSDYLRGVNCSSDELHLLCSERFGQDWHELGGRFGTDDWPGHASSAPQHLHKRVANSTKELTYSSGILRISSLLDPADRAFVRRCMFPRDALLHETLCSSTASRI